ncbi:hypothetical protein [Sorangium sp. So ce233]|uniref:hypothetical protein n=1 Tax=Sorangium sp. So ce233 TaxID=3133290 RepID=UPI003F63F40A
MTDREEQGGGTALDAPSTERAREHEERRARRGKTDVNYGATEEQVPAEGWVS